MRRGVEGRGWIPNIWYVFNIYSIVLITNLTKLFADITTWQGGETLLVMSSSHFRLDEEESWPSLPRRTTIFKFRRGKEQVNPLVMSKKTCYQLLPTTTTTTTEQRGQGMGAHPRYLVRFFYTYSIVPITNYTKLFVDTTDSFVVSLSI